MSDLIFHNHGSLFCIEPASPVGQAWLEEHVITDETQFWGGSVVCEPRYVADIVTGAAEDGLEVV